MFIQQLYDVQICRRGEIGPRNRQTILHDVRNRNEMPFIFRVYSLGCCQTNLQFLAQNLTYRKLYNPFENPIIYCTHLKKKIPIRLELQYATYFAYTSSHKYNDLRKSFFVCMYVYYYIKSNQTNIPCF